jgi:hypothetical protein
MPKYRLKWSAIQLSHCCSSYEATRDVGLLNLNLIFGTKGSAYTVLSVNEGIIHGHDFDFVALKSNDSDTMSGFFG